MFSLYRSQRAAHHDPGHPHHHDAGGAVIETRTSGTKYSWVSNFFPTISMAG